MWSVTVQQVACARSVIENLAKNGRGGVWGGGGRGREGGDMGKKREREAGGLSDLVREVRVGGRAVIWKEGGEIGYNGRFVGRGQW